eukprot:XP_008185789.1 PREDICTED: RNA-directed DNA polymerase from mobile element jockey-like [Acyrthosiphon pisum]
MSNNTNINTNNTQNSPFQGSLTRDIGPQLIIFQLNVEGLSRDKSSYLARLLPELKADVVLLQETHVPDEEQMHCRGNIDGYKLISAIYHKQYGTATYIRNDISNLSHIHTTMAVPVSVITTSVANITILNIYKPPNEKWPLPTLPSVQHPSVLAGDFNSHHTSWGYDENYENGEILSEWIETENMQLIFSGKDRHTFKSGKWNRGYNPDLCIVSKDHNGVSLQVQRSVLNNFPKSQHRPVRIQIGIQIPLVKTLPKPRWNFRKANWTAFSKSLDNNIWWIDPIVNKYERFIGMVKGTAKRNIPRGYRHKYIPCWNEESDRLYTEYQRNGQAETVDKLLESLAKGRKDRWTETVEHIDFKHSSREAWNVLRRLEASKNRGGSEPEIKPNAFANRLIETSRAKIDKDISRKLTMDLKVKKTHAVENSKWADKFTPEKVQLALKRVKLRKAAGLD